MGRVKVTFQPDSIEAEAQSGEKLIDVAARAAININNLCGGQGVCGKCRVMVKKGKLDLTGKVIGKLSRKEIEQGYTLACQAEVLGDDLEIWIPPESRTDVQIQISDYVVSAGEPAPAAGHDYEPAPIKRPLSVKYYLELPTPSIEDSLSDLDRVYRALRKKIPEFPYIHAHFSCLWGLSGLLRANDWKITATVHLGDADCPMIREIEGGDTTSANMGVAIDIGTTTIAAQLIDLHTGSVLGAQASHNSQARYGQDVVSRMIIACGQTGMAPLTDAVLFTINSLIDSLVKKHKIKHRDITSLVAAGNTVMTHLLLGIEPCNIRLAPYIPAAARFPHFQTDEVGLKANPKAFLHCVPCVSSYVGGDITAGVYACGMHDHEEISALIDVGTNGEIVIGNNEWLVCCSASAGPAFEGAGIKCGTKAILGAIEKIAIDGDHVHYETIGAGKPVGVCGSAIIDGIAELLASGIIDQSGKFILLDHPRVQVVDDVPELIVAPCDQTATGEPIVITEDDISNLIKTKGAILAAVRVLLKTLGMDFLDLEKLYVAGGFGAHLDIEKAIFIGLLPDIPKERISFIGNSSLAGARLGLLSARAFHRMEEIANRMTYLELSVHPDFMNEFIAALFLPHTDVELFPTVTGKLKRRQNGFPVP
ncbi:MAG: ASKHA domain-containing protein [Syntrophobacteraceae bacterium]|nr:ASKHA domain-containing protein [Syntrophobacteraceae bacterium]